MCYAIDSWLMAVAIAITVVTIRRVFLKIRKGRRIKHEAALLKWRWLILSRTLTAAKPTYKQAPSLYRDNGKGAHNAKRIKFIQSKS